MTNRLGNVPHEIEPANGEEHLAALLARQNARVQRKYRRGQAEHGGMLHRKPVLPYLLEEVDDLVVYADTHARQQALVVELLGKALSEKSFTLVAQAFNVLVIGNIDGVPEEERNG